LLARAAVRAGRAPESIRLLAVSKKMPVAAVLEAAAAGQLEFGENFVQEGYAKVAAADRADLTWHFIGRLQSNKSRPVAEAFHWVHTVDRPKIAERLSEQRPTHAPPLNVCIQVNIDREPGKSGVLEEGLRDLAARVAALPRLKLRGLMCIPAMREGFDSQRVPFAALRARFESLCAEGFDLDTLSMGMSDDYEAAVFEGATIVRIGTAIFGPRGGTSSARQQGHTA